MNFSMLSETRLIGGENDKPTERYDRKISDRIQALHNSPEQVETMLNLLLPESGINNIRLIGNSNEGLHYMGNFGSEQAFIKVLKHGYDPNKEKFDEGKIRRFNGEVLNNTLLGNQNRYFVKVLDAGSIGSAYSVERIKTKGDRRLKDRHNTELFYLANEYIPGKTFRQVLDNKEIRRKIKLSDRIHIIEDVLEGLSYMHSQNMVHRDINPNNIIVPQKVIDGVKPEDDLYAKICDLGMASPMKDAEQGRVIRGTIPYIAPEMVEGNGGFTSDQFSLGIILYETLEGQHPFAGEIIDLENGEIYKHAEKNYPEIAREYNGTNSKYLKALMILEANRTEPLGRLSDFNGDVNGLEDIIRKSLQKDPINRFRDLNEMGKELMGWRLHQAVA